MAAHTYGLATVPYGFGTITQTGFVLQSGTVSSKTGVNAVVINELGQEVHRRYDDLITELSLEILVTTGTAPVPGMTFAFNSITYEVQSVDVKYESKGFQTVSVKGKASANCASS